MTDSLNFRNQIIFQNGSPPQVCMRALASVTRTSYLHDGQSQGKIYVVTNCERPEFGCPKYDNITPGNPRAILAYARFGFVGFQTVRLRMPRVRQKCRMSSGKSLTRAAMFMNL